LPSTTDVRCKTPNRNFLKTFVIESNDLIEYDRAAIRSATVLGGADELATSPEQRARRPA
jgi:hypothetical protein